MADENRKVETGDKSSLDQLEHLKTLLNRSQAEQSLKDKILSQFNELDSAQINQMIVALEKAEARLEKIKSGKSEKVMEEISAEKRQKSLANITALHAEEMNTKQNEQVAISALESELNAIS